MNLLNRNRMLITFEKRSKNEVQNRIDLVGTFIMGKLSIRRIFKSLN